VESERRYSDKRYEGRCSSSSCSRRDLMPFMRYCPWCHRKVAKTWRLRNSEQKCHRCGWGVAGDYWNHCAWCAAPLPD
jgi:hypothetical protein